jgi:hypothetical protein
MKLFIIAFIGLTLGYAVAIWLPPSELFDETDEEDISTEDASFSEIGLPSGLTELEQNSELLSGSKINKALPGLSSNQARDSDQASSTVQTEPAQTAPELAYHLMPSDLLALPGEEQSFGIEVNGLINSSDLTGLRSKLADYPEVFAVRFQQPNGRAGAKVFLGTFTDRDSAKLYLLEQVEKWPSFEFNVAALPDCVVNGPEDEDGFKCGPPPETKAEN